MQFVFSIAAVLAVVGLTRAAAPAAQATYCSEDNLLRAFQHTPTPASKYCTTAAGYPTFLAVTSYPATRLSSACSCFSRFPTEGVPASTSTSTTSAPACTATATHYTFDSTGQGYGALVGAQIHILVTIGPSGTCSSGFSVTAMCGTFNGNAVSLNLNDNYDSASYCFYPGDGSYGTDLDAGGVDFQAGGSGYNFFGNGDYYIEPEGSVIASYFLGDFAVVCGSATCPT